MDLLSNEWHDGLIGRVFREFSNKSQTSLSGQRYWVVFDGPIDFLWIENLNTALDDNRKLCLVSGEVVTIPNHLNIFFEVVDLEYSTPGTVSRCGIVYLHENTIGDWSALHRSFCQILLDQIGLSEIYLNLYEDMVNWLVPAALEFLTECTKMLEISSIQHYQVEL